MDRTKIIVIVCLNINMSAAQARFINPSHEHPPNFVFALNQQSI